MNTLTKMLATGFGSGYAPRFPGTTGSLLAAVFAWFVELKAGHIIFLCLVGVYICGQGEKILDSTDSPHIVFDEFCGLFIAVWQLDSIGHFFTAFILFRFFDMVKPFPINKLQELPGGWGVMVDDVAAGLAARTMIYLYMMIR